MKVLQGLVEEHVQRFGVPSGQKFSGNKFFVVSRSKNCECGKIYCAIEVFIVNFVECIFLMGRFERLHCVFLYASWGGRGDNYEIIYASLFI